MYDAANFGISIRSFIQILMTLYKDNYFIIPINIQNKFIQVNRTNFVFFNRF